MKRAIEITKTNLEDENLNDLLIALGYELISESNLKLIYSAMFDTSIPNSGVWDVAMKIRDSFRDHSKIDEEFTLGAIIQFKDGGFNRHHFLEVHSAVQRSYASSVEITVNPSPNVTDNCQHTCRLS